MFRAIFVCLYIQSSPETPTSCRRRRLIRDKEFSKSDDWNHTIGTHCTRFFQSKYGTVQLLFDPRLTRWISRRFGGRNSYIRYRKPFGLSVDLCIWILLLNSLARYLLLCCRTFLSEQKNSLFVVHIIQVIFALILMSDRVDLHNVAHFAIWLKKNVECVVLTNKWLGC